MLAFDRNSVSKLTKKPRIEARGNGGAQHMETEMLKIEAHGTGSVHSSKRIDYLQPHIRPPTYKLLGGGMYMLIIISFTVPDTMELAQSELMNILPQKFHIPSSQIHLLNSIGHGTKTVEAVAVLQCVTLCPFLQENLVRYTRLT